MSKQSVAIDDRGFAFDTTTGNVLVSPIRTLYERSLNVGVDCSGEPSLTVQADMPGCDLNTIMAQYERTGIHGFEDRMAQGGFVDLASMPDFRLAQDTVIAAREAFDSLPALVRRRFDNDPGEFLAFMDDPSNADEAVHLGLATRPVPAPNPPDLSVSGSSGASDDA